MTYALSNRLFVENGPTVLAARAQSRSSAQAYRAWQSLDSDRRIELVDSIIRKPANDRFPDEFPIAL